MPLRSFHPHQCTALHGKGRNAKHGCTFECCCCVCIDSLTYIEDMKMWTLCTQGFTKGVCLVVSYNCGTAIHRPSGKPPGLSDLCREPTLDAHLRVPRKLNGSLKQRTRQVVSSSLYISCNFAFIYVIPRPVTQHTVRVLPFQKRVVQAVCEVNMHDNNSYVCFSSLSRPPPPEERSMVVRSDNHSTPH
jgi:hypothetical protein